MLAHEMKRCFNCRPKNLDTSLLLLRTEGTCSSPCGVIMHLLPVPLFTGVQLLQHVANRDTSWLKRDRSMSLIASTRPADEFMSMLRRLPTLGIEYSKSYATA